MNRSEEKPAGEISDHKAVRIAEGVYWVGSETNPHGLQCNPYLLIDAGEGVLIDPGSKLDFDEVYRKVTAILPLESLKYIVLLHQDPDLASSVTLFEERGFSGEVATHWRTTLFAVYYGITSTFYMINEQGYALTFGSSRRLDFIPAPYLHFPGALMALDSRTAVLFSGDLFGSISMKWSLYAGEGYEEGMKTFHEHYMPSNEILRPVMEILLKKKIEIICPQHGSVITSEVRRYIEILRDLECGTMLSPIRRDLIAQGGYAYLMDQVLKRLVSVFGLEEVLACFRDSPFMLNNESGRPEKLSGKAEELWNSFFELIYAHGGSRWLSLVEPLIQQFETRYGVSRPRIYLGELAREKRRTLDLQEEKEKLERANENLRSNLELTREEMTKDQVTGLYNEDFLVRYLLNIFNETTWEDFTLFFIRIDDMKQINDNLGEDEGDEIISGVGGLLIHGKHTEDYLFRVSGPVFVLISPESDIPSAEGRGEEIRSSVERDRGFLERITVTVAVLQARFADLGKMPAAETMNFLFSRGSQVLRTSLREGGNRVVLGMDEENRAGMEGRVLIAEYDRFHAELIENSLERLSMEVRVCLNVPEAAAEAKEFHPNVIISELFLPEIDAFSVKEQLDENTKTRDIPFILISHQ
ncbi:MAG: diguanylate cyclase, partial [Spirochaetia bacterium]